jgi:hypothetical protein
LHQQQTKFHVAGLLYEHVKFHPSFQYQLPDVRINNNSIETFSLAYLIAFCAISTGFLFSGSE